MEHVLQLFTKILFSLSTGREKITFILPVFKYYYFSHHNAYLQNLALYVIILWKFSYHEISISCLFIIYF